MNRGFPYELEAEVLVTNMASGLTKDPPEGYGDGRSEVIGVRLAGH